MIHLINGDCTQLPVADAAAFHVMITDPPYRDHVHSNAVSQSVGGGVRERDLGFAHLSQVLQLHIASMAGVVKRWSVIYSDVESLGEWRRVLLNGGAEYIRVIPWVRWSMPQLSGDRPPSGFEPLTVAWGTQGGRKSWNGPGNLTHLDHKCLRGEDKHKTEKPLDQALDLVSWFSNEGETVFDPTAGRATIGLACRLLGRSYLGFEIDPVEHARGLARLTASHLSERDSERWTRWLESQEKRKQDDERRKANTDKVRAKLDTKRSAG